MLHAKKMRSWLGLTTGLLMSAVWAGGAAGADIEATMKDLAVKAAANGPVIWYESSPQAAGDQTIAAFNKRFPNVKVEHIRDAAGVSMSARIIQEVQANVRTADIGTNGYALLWPLVQRGLIESVDWAALGMDPKQVPTPYATLATIGTYIIVYNTNLVKDADAPKTWDDLTDPKWTGKFGTWASGGVILAALSATWGDQRVVEFIQKLNKLNPFLFKSTFSLAQQMASGEVAVGLGIYHTTLPAIRRGAPLKFALADPTPTGSLLNFIPKAAKNKEGAKLLALWLSTPEGALAFEAAAVRGNPMVPQTETAKMLAGRKLSEHSFDKLEEMLERTSRYNKMLAEGGKSAD